ncbi:hypothetical protein P4E94_15840 [Pontiellaceae bacterium B12219]|nr:hypothetical protein [Pontiellaceae bacterium B12219]
MADSRTEHSCEIADKCSFFERNEGLNNTIRTVRKIFCNGQQKNHCARYEVYQQLGLDKVPEELMPFDHLAADSLVEAEKKAPV